MPKKFVYQLSVRKPDEDIKKFRIETDTIYSESELTEEQLKVISEKNKCDLFVQYIGYLVEPKKPQEKIQSNLEKVNYKKQIERGELLLNDSITGEGIRDYTSLPGDKVNFIDFIAKIGQLSPEQIDQMVKQVSGVPEGQPKESKQENGEAIDTTQQSQPDSGGTAPEVNGGNK